MHGDLESFFGGGHEVVPHDTHQHDIFEEALFPVQSAAEGAMQVFSMGMGLAHLLHDTAHMTVTHLHGLHSHDAQTDTETSASQGWHEVNGVGNEPHLHLLRHSEAHDANGDGVSDAASRNLGINAVGGSTHQVVSLDWHDASGHLHHSHGKDSDGDGWTDDVERLAGTNPHDPNSHPSLVEAHHFPAGSGENLPGTIDVTPSAAPWYSV